MLQRVLPSYNLRVHETNDIPGIQLSTLTGSGSIVSHLDDLWVLVEKVNGRPVDPLDTRFIGEE